MHLHQTTYLFSHIYKLIFCLSPHTLDQFLRVTVVTSSKVGNNLGIVMRSMKISKLGNTLKQQDSGKRAYFALVKNSIFFSIRTKETQLHCTQTYSRYSFCSVTQSEPQAETPQLKCQKEQHSQCVCFSDISVSNNENHLILYYNRFLLALNESLIQNNALTVFMFYPAMLAEDNSK